ncbi:hypothetical protein [Streptomyces sp. NPDC098781]|uniref:hypothetical protein n=1 Tax=Streptomyces sp. NPDC098781 TaxID=3366097 RepID=UPI0037FF870F
MATLAHRHAEERDGEPASSSVLRDRRFNGYLRIKLPHALDAEVESVVTAYVAGSASTRQALIDGLGERAAGVLSAYGQRMASVAVRIRSVDALRRGAVAVALAEGFLEDRRDNLFVLAAVHDSASLIGTSLAEVIDDVKALLPPVGLAALHEFEQREERDKSLAALGIRRSGTGQDFLYL